MIFLNKAEVHSDEEGNKALSYIYNIGLERSHGLGSCEPFFFLQA